MAGMSNYLEQTFLDWYFRRQTWTGSNPKLRLYSTVHSDWDAFTGGTELTGTGYTSGGQVSTRGSTDWEVVTSGNGYYAQNKLTSAFSWSVGSDWPAINGAGFYDNAGTNPLWGAALTTPRDPASGDTFRFAAAAIKLGLDVTTAAGLTNTAKLALLNHLVIADGSSSRPADPSYIALWTTLPNKYTGAGGTEVSTAGTGYARLSVTMSTAWHAAASVGTGYHIHNSSAFSGWSAASTAWGNILGASIVDTTSGAIGAQYAIDDFAAGIQVDAGDTFSIAADGFLISIDESN